MAKMKNDYLALRVSPELKQKFHEKALQYGDDRSTVHRIILEAFVDGRLTITPDPTKPSLYKEPQS